MVRDVPHLPRAPAPAAQAEAATASATKCLPIRLLTHNIRYAATDLDENERPWPERCPLLLNELRYHTRFLDGALTPLEDDSHATSSHSVGGASFICLQEVLHNQLRDILNGLNSAEKESSSSKLHDGPLWSHIGIGRDDGKEDGEYSPILYPTRLFKLLHFENTWLSPTPDRPSKGWDAGNKRILTSGVFEHRFSKQRVAIFNTHLDNEGAESRLKSVPIILDVIQRVRKEWSVSTERHHGGLNFALAGDFNSRPNAEAYQGFAASGKVVDAFEKVPANLRYGDLATFSGFTPKPDDGLGLRRIDVVWYGPKFRIQDTDRTSGIGRSASGWRIEGYATIPNVFDDKVYSSDHRAVVTDAVLCSD